MSPTPREALRALVEKWRSDKTCHTDDYYAGQLRGRNLCADELEAALLASDASPQPPEQLYVKCVACFGTGYTLDADDMEDNCVECNTTGFAPLRADASPQASAPPPEEPTD